MVARAKGLVVPPQGRAIKLASDGSGCVRPEGGMATAQPEDLPWGGSPLGILDGSPLFPLSYWEHSSRAPWPEARPARRRHPCSVPRKNAPLQNAGPAAGSSTHSPPQVPEAERRGWHRLSRSPVQSRPKAQKSETAGEAVRFAEAPPGRRLRLTERDPLPLEEPLAPPVAPAD